MRERSIVEEEKTFPKKISSLSLAGGPLDDGGGDAPVTAAWLAAEATTYVYFFSSGKRERERGVPFF